uniref:E3 ubiquitin-protein ligase TRIM68-like n=1 Tax=Pundamilia nyererei TaxID=303518 RepID=A0A3B4FPN2_9CICH
MASPASLIAEENFHCSICLSVFSKPVSTPCGHNFCIDCITGYWDTSKPLITCPLCKEEFNIRPKLRKLLALKKHKLIHPVENLESRICKDHGEPLDLFCSVDQMFLCDSCKDRDHKQHKTVTLEEEALMRKDQLESEKKDANKMVDERQQKIWEIERSLEANKNNAAKALSCSEHVMTTKQRKKQAEADGLINELKGEIMQITQKSQQLDNISVTDDPFRFLESYLSLTIIPPQVKDWSDVTLKIRRHAVELTLDPDTANSHLYISEDGKEGFASGRFYYEVQVKDKTQWDLGVAKQSINRRGDIRLSPKNGYWTIWLRKGNEFTANTDPPVNLHVTEVPEKIGVFVDYEDGQVSFHDVDTRASIFSFTGCNFTEKIFPFFSPCATNGAENSAPLIITPVRNNK